MTAPLQLAAGRGAVAVARAAGCAPRREMVPVARAAGCAPRSEATS